MPQQLRLRALCGQRVGSLRACVPQPTPQGSPQERFPARPPAHLHLRIPYQRPTPKRSAQPRGFSSPAAFVRPRRPTGIPVGLTGQPFGATGRPRRADGNGSSVVLRPTVPAEARSTADGATHATRLRTNGETIGRVARRNAPGGHRRSSGEARRDRGAHRVAAASPQVLALVIGYLRKLLELVDQIENELASLIPARRKPNRYGRVNYSWRWLPCLYVSSGSPT